MPPFDTFKQPPASDPWFLVGAQQLKERTRLSTWVRQLVSTETITYPQLCQGLESMGHGSLDHTRVRTFGMRCPADFPNSVGVQHLAVKDGRGYLVLCFSEEALGGDVQALARECQKWLASFRFTSN